MNYNKTTKKSSQVTAPCPKLLGLWFFFPMGPRQTESHGATHLHRAVIDVKRGIARRVKANTPPPFHSTVRRRIPIQYLLRHLRSNLGWQAQMASLIQVNYLLNLSEQTDHHSAAAPALSRQKGLGKVKRVHMWMHTHESMHVRRERRGYKHRLWLWAVTDVKVLTRDSKEKLTHLVFAPGKRSGWQLQKGCLWFRVPAQTQNLTFFVESACGSCCIQYANKTPPPHLFDGS